MDIERVAKRIDDNCRENTMGGLNPNDLVNFP